MIRRLLVMAVLNAVSVASVCTTPVSASAAPAGDTYGGFDRAEIYP